MLFKLLFFLSVFSFSQEKASPCKGVEAPFLGEKLIYEISWGILTVGHADIYVPELIEISSSCAYKITSTARSSSLIETFYPVRDYNEAWPDISLKRSYGYYKKIKEGKYLKKEKVIYDYEKKLFMAETENKKGEKKNSQGELYSDSMDIFSSLFLARTIDIKKSESVSVKVNTKKNWEMKIVGRGTEKVKTKAGKFKCYIVEPMVGEEGIFVPKKGKRMFVYISKKEKIPVMLKAEIFIGTITATLVKVEKVKE